MPVGPATSGQDATRNEGRFHETALTATICAATLLAGCSYHVTPEGLEPVTSTQSAGTDARDTQIAIAATMLLVLIAASASGGGGGGGNGFVLEGPNPL